MQNDTITFNFDKNCDTIKLVGQNGVILQVANNIKSLKYQLRPEDTYVRAEVNQANSVNVFLNPLFRYDKLEALKNKPETDLTMTWILRSAYICAAFLIIFLLYRRKKMKRLIR